jgi:acetoin utilization protein AcuB
MQVGDIMTREVVAVGLDTTVRQVRQFFERRPFHHVLVADCGELVGVVSDRDLLKNLSPFVGNVLAERPQDRALLDRRIHRVMTRKPVSVVAETPVRAAWLMLEKDTTCLPVVDERLGSVGIVTARDMLQFLCRLLSPGSSGSRVVKTIRPGGAAASV